MRVLVVEDTPDLREMMRDVLQEEGFEVVTAMDGADALESLEEDGGFDAVVLDHEMPRLNGLELLSLLRSRGRRVPVVLCSGSLSLTPEECARLDIGPVVPKPFTTLFLVEAIRAALQARP